MLRCSKTDNEKKELEDFDTDKDKGLSRSPEMRRVVKGGRQKGRTAGGRGGEKK